MSHISRRKFLESSVTAGCAAGLSGAGFASSLIAALWLSTRRSKTRASPRHFAQEGLVLDMLPPGLSYSDRFKMARDAGFDVVQAPTTPDEHTARRSERRAAANIRIDSVMNTDHWKYPLSSDDPQVVEKKPGGMRTSLHNAKLWGRTRCCSFQPW